MNRLSSTIFGQLFYLKNNGLFVNQGLPHAVYNGLYKETFSVGSMRHSTLEFLYNNKLQDHFWFQSTIVLDGRYREFYRFDASSYGVKEQHNLCYLQDGWVEKNIQLEDLQPLLSTLKNSEHIVHESNVLK